MNIGRLCRRLPVTIGEHATLTQAAQLMREKHVGHLIVVTPEPGFTLGRAVGVLTDRDIVISVVAAGADPRALTVADVMSQHLVTVHETDAVETCLRTMRSMGVRRLPVVGSDGELLGIVALEDLLDFLATEIDDLSGTIRNEHQIEHLQRP